MEFNAEDDAFWKVKWGGHLQRMIEHEGMLNRGTKGYNVIVP